MPRVAVRGVARDSRVAYVEEDSPVSAFAQTLPTGLDRIFRPGTLTIEPGSDEEIDAALTIDGLDDARVDAAVAVLDTGIDREHPDLNVVGGTNCLKYKGNGPAHSRSYFCADNENGDDDNYHGTHVAGTIGALDNGIGVVGVAPGVDLYAVKVLDSSGSGYASTVLAGIDWVLEQGDIDVINMSLGGSGVNEAYETAISNAVAAGVTVVVAAGNSDADANEYSPAFAPSAITVSALADFDGQDGGWGSPTCRNDDDDTLANFSNWGTAVDITAPGVCILSTIPVEWGSYRTFSGTSMAAPHVAGAAALLASTGMTVSEIRDTLLSTGNFDWTGDADSYQEPLLDVSTFTPGVIAGPGNAENAAPTAHFDHAPETCIAGEECSFSGSGSTDTDGTIVTYSWEFDDAGVSGGVAPSHVFEFAGAYDVTLTVIDNDGASDFVTQPVTVSPGASNTGDDCDGAGTSVLLTPPSSSSERKTWTAIVDAINCVGGDPANFITVSPSWSPAIGTPGMDCSGGVGHCRATMSKIRKNTGAVEFSLNGSPPVTVFKP